MKEMSEADVRRILRDAIPWKGANKTAAKIGVSQGHLSDMLNGKKPLNEKALAFIGCKRIIIRTARKSRLQSSAESA